MAHNIYINLALSSDNDKFPSDFGLISEIKKEIGLIIQKYPEFKIKRYNFDVVEDQFDIEEDVRSDVEDDTK